MPGGPAGFEEVDTERPDGQRGPSSPQRGSCLNPTVTIAVKVFIFVFNSVYISVCLWECIHWSIALAEAKEGDRFFRAGVTGICESPVMGPENQTLPEQWMSLTTKLWSLPDLPLSFLR